MTARVAFNAATAMGQLAAEAIDQIIEGKSKLNRLSEVLYAAIYVPSGPADFAAVEAELGVAAGKEQAFFDLINGAKTALDDSRIAALREVDQG